MNPLISTDLLKESTRVYSVDGIGRFPQEVSGPYLANSVPFGLIFTSGLLDENNLSLI